VVYPNVRDFILKHQPALGVKAKAKATPKPKLAAKKAPTPVKSTRASSTGKTKVLAKSSTQKL